MAWRQISDIQGFLEKTPRWLDPKFQGNRDYKGLYQLLKENPALARERVSYMSIGLQYFLLSYFLAAQSPLHVVKEVYHMFPDVISIAGYFPLHNAITYRCSFEVISYLVEKNPSAVAQKLRNGKLPMDLLLSNMLSKDNDNEEEEHHQQHINDDGGEREDFTNQFQVLHNANPSIFWDDGGSTSRILLGRCRLSLLLESPKTPLPLLAWLARKQQVYTGSSSTLTVYTRPYNESTMQTMIKNLQSFVPHLPNGCKELKIKGDYSRGPSWLLLEQLLSKVTIPPNLSIHFEKIYMYFDFNFGSIPQLGWSHCQVEEIKLTHLETTNLFMPARRAWHNVAVCLFRNLRHLPNLKRLFLTNDIFLTNGISHELTVPITDAVVELLEKAPHLDLLSIKGRCFVVDGEEMLKAMQMSKPRTLVWCSEKDTVPTYDFAIAYHSSLHQNRPKIAAVPNATTMHVIDTLASVQTINAGQSFSSPGLLVESVWYELLREAPALWVTSAIKVVPTGSSAEKRKRQNSFDHQNKKGKTVGAL